MTAMFRNKTVMATDFSMVPRNDIPRSKMSRRSGHKTTFDEGYLIPIYVEEVFPGDSFNVRMTAFARLTTPIFPIMDNMYLDSFFFYCPYRILWQHWINFMGEQANPGDSISYTIPTITSPANGWTANSLQDYMGLGTVGQVLVGNTVTDSNLPGRAYNYIWNYWFRDENLQNSITQDYGDGPDTAANYTLQRRGKRFDYFTSCLPWPQKGNTAVSLPLGTSAPVKGNGINIGLTDGSGNFFGMSQAGSAISDFSGTNYGHTLPGSQSGGSQPTNGAFLGLTTDGTKSGMIADLSNATAATINLIRLAVATQQFLERDARGGTRYPELVLSHFGVVVPDYRTQRPEYLGGGSSPINISPIAQTSGTSASGTTTPLGNLAAIGTMVAKHGFTKSFVEHGVIIGLVSIRADLTYQQGTRRFWSRRTRYDFYDPVFANIGEMAVLNQEIYRDGSANDTNVFGYQEPWGDMRYRPSMITGQFRSTYATPLDAWHLSQKFTSLPTLNSTFIQDTPPVSRISAAPVTGSHFYFDSLFEETVARPMPLRGVPGLMRL